jgi:amidase
MMLGDLTSQQLVECYLGRIEQVNPWVAAWVCILMLVGLMIKHSSLRSVSEINPDALAIASALDEEREVNGTRGPLHGIPFMVKDNHYTDDKFNTSEGGLVLLGGRYSSEATVVRKMRQAGAVLLGHTALSEAADHRALTNFSDGYSTRVGQTRNPFNLSQATSGSSGGSAVSVRANLAALAFGTETHG